MAKSNKIYAEANKIGHCGALNGGEDLKGLIEAFFTPQGIEFCTKNNFPSLNDLLSYKGVEAEDLGFYINTPIKDTNRERVALFGKETKAVLSYDNADHRYEVIVMHRASVEIKASGWSVVFVTNCGGKVHVEQDGNARVFIKE